MKKLFLEKTTTLPDCKLRSDIPNNSWRVEIVPLIAETLIHSLPQQGPLRTKKMQNDKRHKRWYPYLDEHQLCAQFSWYESLSIWCHHPCPHMQQVYHCYALQLYLAPLQPEIRQKNKNIFIFDLNNIYNRWRIQSSWKTIITLMRNLNWLPMTKFLGISDLQKPAARWDWPIGMAITNRWCDIRSRQIKNW